MTLPWSDRLSLPWWRDPVQREKAAAFAAAYAARCDLPPEWLAEYGRYAEPCDPSRCGDEDCESWQMGYQWEEALTEDQERQFDWDAIPPITEWPEDPPTPPVDESNARADLALYAAGRRLFSGADVEYGPVYGFSVRSTNGFMDLMEAFKKYTDIVAEIIARDILRDLGDALRDLMKASVASEAKKEARRHRTKFQRKRPRW